MSPCVNDAASESSPPSGADIDISSQDYLAKPWRTLRRIGETSPVFWSDNLQGWILTRHADVKAAYADPRFSSTRLDSFIRALPGDAAEICPNFVKYHALNVNFFDGREHARARRLMMMGFTPKRIRLLKPVIDDIITDLLDQAEAVREFEFHAQISTKLPTRVIQAMLGVSSAVSDAFFRLADQVVRAADTFPPTPELMRTADAAIVSLNALFTPLIEERHGCDTNDVLADLVRSHDADDRLDHDELLAACHAIVEAGSETTSHMLAIGLYEIATRPKLAAMVRLGEDEALTVVNELLRFPGLVMGMSRIVKEDCSLHGQALAEGDIVFMMNAGANTDTAVFENPEDIIPGRDGSASLAFGPGLHFCIGHYLAKAELSAFFHAMFSRFDVDIEEPAPQFISSWIFHGYKELRVSVRRRD